MSHILLTNNPWPFLHLHYILDIWSSYYLILFMNYYYFTSNKLTNIIPLRLFLHWDLVRYWSKLD